MRMTIAAAAILLSIAVSVNARADIPSECRHHGPILSNLFEQKAVHAKEVQGLQFGGALLLQLMGGGYAPKSKDVLDVLQPYAKWFERALETDAKLSTETGAALKCIAEN